MKRHFDEHWIGYVLLLGLVLIFACSVIAVSRAYAQAPCDVESVERIRANGGSGDWSHVHNRIAYHAWDSRNTYQLRMMDPDGSGDVCLTCTARTGAPAVNRHKMAPTWHPSGDYLIVQVEMASHPLSWLREKWSSELHVNGLWTDLWATSPDGARWWRLTSYRNTQADGAMHARFDASGERVVWSRMVEPAGGAHAFGQYRLLLADFTVTRGVPSFTNVRDITPEGAGLIEGHGFTPDGSGVLFAGDIGKENSWETDIYVLDLETRTVTNLTASPHWDEHAGYTPDGRALLWMSSEPYWWWGMHAELLLQDGESRRILTHFNEWWSPHYIAGGAMPTRHTWGPGGDQLALTVQLGSQYPQIQYWMVTFAGPCGGVV